MHYAPQALLSCVAWFSLLAHGNAARGVAPTEVLSHFARTVGSVLEPSLTAEKSKPLDDARRAPLKARQVNGQEAAAAAAAAPTGAGAGIPFQNPAIPFQFYQALRYPAYAQQQLAPNFYPGLEGFGNHLANGLPIHPRFLQQYAANSPRLPGLQPGVNNQGLAASNVIPNNNSKNNNNNSNNNSKEKEKIKNADANADSKSSAQQNRPFDSADFSPFNQIGGGGGGGGGVDPNLRVDGRFSALDYDRLRQNYFGNNNNPGIDQQRNYFSSLNEIPFSSGPPYRQQLGSQFGYNNPGPGAQAGGQAGAAGQAGSPGDGVGPNGGAGQGAGGLVNPYFNPYLQGPYNQGFNYNGIPGSAGAAGIGGGQFNGFDPNFRSPFGVAGPQFQGGFNSPFFPGGGIGPGGLGGAGGGQAGGQGFNGQDSSLRASSVAGKQSSSETEAPEEEASPESLEAQVEDISTARVEGTGEKIRFVDEEEKEEQNKDKEEEESSEA